MIFAGEPLPDIVALRDSADRWFLLNEIISSFHQAFPEIEFQLDAGTRTINAQAVVLSQSRCVRLYGGLAFHPLVGSDALIFALLHETGHHLAIGARLAWNPMLACECVADRWAVKEGAIRLETITGRRLKVETALKDLVSIGDFARYPDDVLACFGEKMGGRQRCWALSWLKHKESVPDDRVAADESVCPLSRMLVSCRVKGGINGSVNTESK